MRQKWRDMEVTPSWLAIYEPMMPVYDLGARTVGKRARVRLRRVSARIAARRLTSYVAKEAPKRDHGLDGLDVFRGV